MALWRAEAEAADQLQKINGNAYYCRAVVKDSPFDVRNGSIGGSMLPVLRGENSHCEKSGDPVKAETQICICYRVPNPDLIPQHIETVKKCYVQYTTKACAGALTVYLERAVRKAIVPNAPSPDVKGK